MPPSVAMREPLNLCLRIIEYRQYARTKQACESAQSDAQTPTGPLAHLVFEFEAELLKAHRIKFTP